MNLLPHTRYERKLLAPGFTTEEALSLVRRHSAGFREAYPERIVNNIYLDSPSLASYYEHVNGTANRVKVRVRWYGEPAGRVENPMLEEKVKRGAVSGKLTHVLPALALNGVPVHCCLESAFSGTGLPEALRASLRHLEPSLFNRYRRRYYVSADGRFRLTLDTALRFARLRKNSPAPAYLLEGASPPIIELKYLPAEAERAAAITNEFPFRVVRCSKYVLGIEQAPA